MPILSVFQEFSYDNSENDERCDRMKIMLDAGHGYQTAGKRSPDGFREYEFNRKTALYARELLENYQNVTVTFAHSDERDVPLMERTDQANSLMVDVYVSIHANAYGNDWNDAGGVETYVYVTKPKEALQLAEKIQSRLVAKTGLKNRGVKTADLHVLRETKMSAILAECGFMTNQNESALLRTESFQKNCASVIVQALAEQYRLTANTDFPPATTRSPATGLYKVQTGAYSKKSNADLLVQRLKAAGFAAVITCQPKTSLYKVQAGAFAEKRNAESLAQHLITSGFAAAILFE
jgi:N-acetylmuramoyl-L-alanine amidase